MYDEIAISAVRITAFRSADPTRHKMTRSYLTHSALTQIEFDFYKFDSKRRPKYNKNCKNTNIYTRKLQEKIKEVLQVIPNFLTIDLTRPYPTRSNPNRERDLLSEILFYQWNDTQIMQQLHTKHKKVLFNVIVASVV